MKKLLTTVFAVLCLNGSLAHAGVDLTALGGMNFQGGANTLNSGFTQSASGSAAQFSYGITGDMDLGMNWGVELGFLYLNSAINATYGTTTTTTKPVVGAVSTATTINVAFNYSWLNVPILATYKFLPFLQAGLGMYLAEGIGNITGTSGTSSASTIVASGTAVGTPVTSSSTVNQGWEGSGLTRFDYGLAAKLRGQYEFIPSWAAVLDVYFNYGLANGVITAGSANGTANTFNSNLTNWSLSSFVGVKYSF